ncbi:uncharacterized protein ACJ7VT_000807 isoform 3-T3 [Polymixia lowei]
MLTRKILLLCSLGVLLVEGDLDTNDGSIQTTSTDKDSTSDEAPTESMNAISPDQYEPQYYGGPSDTSSTSTETGANKEPQYYGGPSDTSSTSTETGANTPATSDMSGPDMVAAADSVEEEDEESPDSDEGEKRKTPQRSAKPQPAAPPAPQPLLPQPVEPQPRPQAVRSRAPSKRRSRTNRRQI